MRRSWPEYALCTVHGTERPFPKSPVRMVTLLKCECPTRSDDMVGDDVHRPTRT